MRFVWGAAGVAGALVACARFSGDDAEPAKDAGASDGSVESGIVVPDAGRGCAPGADFFCDDFDRPTDVRGPWTDFDYKSRDPAPTLDEVDGNRALHFRYPANVQTDGDDRYYHSFLKKTVPCVNQRIAVAFRFRADATTRNQNLAVFTINPAGGGRDSEVRYVAVAYQDGVIHYGDSGRSNGAEVSYAPHGLISPLPAPNVWHAIGLTIDLRATKPLVGASVDGSRLGDEQSELGPLAYPITACELDLGADFVGDGEATERWYDDVRINLQ